MVGDQTINTWSPKKVKKSVFPGRGAHTPLPPHVRWERPRNLPASPTPSCVQKQGGWGSFPHVTSNGRRAVDGLAQPVQGDERAACAKPNRAEPRRSEAKA